MHVMRTIYIVTSTAHCSNGSFDFGHIVDDSINYLCTDNAETQWLI